MDSSPLLASSQGRKRNPLQSVSSSRLNQLPPTPEASPAKRARIEYQQEERPRRRLQQASPLKEALIQQSLGFKTSYESLFARNRALKSFCSRPADSRMLIDKAEPSPVLPFAMAACNNNSIFAVADEAGQVRLYDSADDVEIGLDGEKVSFGLHENSIFDLSWSPDDLKLVRFLIDYY